MKFKAVTQCSTNPQEKSKNPLHSINFAIVVATNAIVQRRAMLNFSTKLSALASFADQREYFRDYQLSRTNFDLAIFEEIFIRENYCLHSDLKYYQRQTE